jgi:rubrerythrin
MKKLFVATLAFSISVSSLFAANVQLQHKAKADTAKTKLAKVQYVCPMHANEVFDKPGKCPVCGMELVKKEPVRKNKPERLK